MEGKNTKTISENSVGNSVENSNIKNKILMISLNKFYEDKDNLDIFLNIITGESKISLRVIDWFVTNYSKKNNISYPVLTKNYTIKNTDISNNTNNEDSVDKRKIKPNRKKIQFIVYHRYKAQLKAYSKKRFDPFCRKNRISDWGPDKNITTTIGQLNFFKWAIQNNVIKYIKQNLVAIEKDMNNNVRKKKTQIKGKDTICVKELKTKTKRKQLSQNASKSICKMSNEILIDFD